MFILYNELAMLSFPSFAFIVFFLQVFWSNFASLLKFFSNKVYKNQPLLSYTFYFMLLSSMSLSPCTSRFLCLQIFPLVFSDFLSFVLFVFDKDCLFWVYALDLGLLSSNLSALSSRSCLFSERRLRTFTVNSLQLFESNGYILP